MPINHFMLDLFKVNQHIQPLKLRMWLWLSILIFRMCINISFNKNPKLLQIERYFCGCHPTTLNQVVRNDRKKCHKTHCTWPFPFMVFISLGKLYTVLVVEQSHFYIKANTCSRYRLKTTVISGHWNNIISKAIPTNRL